MRPQPPGAVDHFCCSECPPGSDERLEPLLEVRFGKAKLLVCVPGRHTVSRGLAVPVYVEAPPGAEQQPDSLKSDGGLKPAE